MPRWLLFLALSTALPAAADDLLEDRGVFWPPFFAEFQDVELAGDRAYMFGVGGLVIFDVSDPDDPLYLGRYAPPDDRADRFYRGSVGGDHAYGGVPRGWPGRGEPVASDRADAGPGDRARRRQLRGQRRGRRLPLRLPPRRGPGDLRPGRPGGAGLRERPAFAGQQLGRGGARRPGPRGRRHGRPGDRRRERSLRACPGLQRADRRRRRLRRALAGDVAVVAAGSTGLVLFDVSDPTRPEPARDPRHVRDGRHGGRRRRPRLRRRLGRRRGGRHQCAGHPRWPPGWRTHPVAPWDWTRSMAGSTSPTGRACASSTTVPPAAAISRRSPLVRVRLHADRRVRRHRVHRRQHRRRPAERARHRDLRRCLRVHAAAELHGRRRARPATSLCATPTRASVSTSPS